MNEHRLHAESALRAALTQEPLTPTEAIALAGVHATLALVCEAAEIAMALRGEARARSTAQEPDSAEEERPEWKTLASDAVVGRGDYPDLPGAEGRFCPECRASPGYPCASQAGHTVSGGYHRARYDGAPF